MKKFSKVDSVAMKCGIIIFLVVLLIIPINMITDLVAERQSSRKHVIQEISHKWGQSQTIIGPILSIPYIRSNKPYSNSVTEYAHFLPESLNIDSNLLPEKRSRNLHETVVYKSISTITGEFKFPDISGLGINLMNLDLKNAIISLGITDSKGISETIEFEANQQKLQFRPGLSNSDVLSSGVHTPLTIEKDKDIKFSIKSVIRGSEFIHFVPIGKETNVKINSSWSSPSFEGSFLPSQRKISDKGFEANWKVLNLNRNYPQKWLGKQFNIATSSFGVRLFIEANIYQQTTRSVKYAFLFILLTFTAFFFCEILYKRQIHPIQYLLIGLSIVIFYTLLLSLSEYISFDIAYWVSTTAIVGIITLYASAILKSKQMALAICTVLSHLYGFLFVLLQLEDMALLLGSFGLFLALAASMYLSKDVDWYKLSDHIKPPIDPTQNDVSTEDESKK
ncbi:MAG: cell envelope integrity protein CreD [Candidatus Cloacimonetes bacterium]|nr:cell envelope integrity protein CreD [Candidatus Cloacimonadota bacterium]